MQFIINGDFEGSFKLVFAIIDQESYLVFSKVHHLRVNQNNFYDTFLKNHSLTQELGRTNCCGRLLLLIKLTKFNFSVSCLCITILSD